MEKPYGSELALNNALLQKWQIKKFSYKNVLRPDYGFLYLLSGEIVYSYPLGSVTLGVGDIVYLPRGSEYEALFNIDNGKIESLLINFDVLRGEPPFKADCPKVIFNDSSGRLACFFEETVRLFNDGSAPFLTKSAFNLCIHSVLSAAASDISASKELAIRQAANMLAENPRLCTAEAARLSGMSPSSFLKHFKYYFGVSPTEYRTEKRLARARLLLETTDMPIKEIAYSLGFYDVSQFYRIFTAYAHTTPKKYREEFFSKYN